MTTHDTREAYLTALIDRLRPVFDSAGYPLPDVALRVSCSFPSKLALSTKNRAVGQCWDSEATTDGSIHLLISPVLSDPIEIAATLVHELVHAAIGCDKKHGPDFKRAMQAVGLTGKPTHTVASESLRGDLEKILSTLGDYPHAAITPKALDAKRQKNRQLKISCSQDDYILRGAKATLDKGIPPCPICGNILELESKEGDDDYDAED